MRPLSQIVFGPVVTEKSTGLQVENTYVFRVSNSANKVEIARAISQLYGVDVASVRTSVVRANAKRFGRHWGTRPGWKKAFVRVVAGQELNVFAAPGADQDGEEVNDG